MSDRLTYFWICIGFAAFFACLLCMVGYADRRNAKTLAHLDRFIREQELGAVRCATGATCWADAGKRGVARFECNPDGCWWSE